jgi:aspartate ammonia-lyase
MRTERDALGEMNVEANALYGIHSARARENFPDRTPFHPEWYMAMGTVKLACYRTYRKFIRALSDKVGPAALHVPLIGDEILDVLIDSASEVAAGKYYDHFIVPAISGGAGTSQNMNVNEIIANASLVKLGKRPGDYDTVDPIEHANVFQSTNDVVPTALHLATMRLLVTLEAAVDGLRKEAEALEKRHRSDLRIAFTQMQAAVPSSYGKLFASYAEALSRDWWRTSKASERIKVINLGGSAVGTGLAVPRFFVFEAPKELAALTNLTLTRSENLPDATANLDPLVEAHAILKAHAVNLEKIASDLRLLSSDIADHGEVRLPARQVGSSIMPGKVNPVIPEFVVSAAHRVYANDGLIARMAGLGCLELNAYLPAIGHALLESLKLLIASDETMKRNMLAGIEVHAERALEALYRSPAIATALVPFIGYHEAERIAQEMKTKGMTVDEANAALGLIDAEKLARLLKPDALLKLGYALSDLTDEGIEDNA